MNKFKALFIITIFFFTSCKILKFNKEIKIQSDINTAKTYFPYINKKELYENLKVLSSDEFEGRETTQPGQKKAADFIKNFFINNGIKSPIDSTYYQTFNVNISDFKRINFYVNDDTLKIVDDFYVIGSTTDTTLINKEIIDVKYGIITNSYNNYQNINVKDKIVLINEDIPVELDLKREWDNWRKKVKIAMEQGAIGVICVKKDYNKSVEILKPYLLYPEMKMHYNVRIKNRLIPYICISKSTYLTYFKNKSSVSTLDIDIEYNATAENVLGYIKGTNNELIVISAHYDHLGYDNGEICNGADDDGSGTVSLMSIAKAFQKAKNDGFTPKRSILFLAVSGEEKGLFGSRYYTDNPIFPLNNTIANLNIDMVGRIDTIHDHINYIYLIGSDKISNELHVINEKINYDHFNFELDYTFNKESDPNHFYYRSDHYNFAKNGIPVIFYFSGIHRDYHKPTDDIEKINFNKLEKTARYIFLTAWELANREKRIQ